MLQQFISYETARAAKKAGFKDKTSHFYGRVFPHHDFAHLHTDLEYFPGDFSCFAPTQCCLAKWLREHCIDITIVTNWGAKGRRYGVGFSYVNPRNEVDIWFHKVDGIPADFPTWEEAMELGLFRALSQLP